jgi:hypothetical protein
MASPAGGSLATVVLYNWPENGGHRGQSSSARGRETPKLRRRRKFLFRNSS